MPILRSRRFPKLILAIGIVALSAPVFAQAPGGQQASNNPSAFGPPPPNGQLPPDRPPPPGQTPTQTSSGQAANLPPPPPPPPMAIQLPTPSATPAVAPTTNAATAAPADEAQAQLDAARQSKDPDQIGNALLQFADLRMQQSQPRQALAALDEAIALANQTGNDRLGREASMAMAAAYDMSGDTAMGDTWRTHADEYRERMANRIAPPPVQIASADAPAAAAARSQAPVSTAMAAGAKSVSQHWPWWLAGLCLILLAAWWQSSRRAAHLHGQAETLARQQRFLKTAHQSLKAQTEQFKKMAVQDALTGTMNRQAFASELDGLLHHAIQYGKPVALFVFDLDHFKGINDRHGHLAGDAALKLVVGVVREKLQSEDLFGRFGGDEFLIGCFGLGREQSYQVGEKIRAAVVERAKIQTAPPMPELSISMGIAHATPASGYEMEGLFARADTALYAAKRAGRNHVVLEDESLPPPPQDQPTLRSLAPAPHEV
jgi:diguanylate cyclase (GGDEF)-like protein